MSAQIYDSRSIDWTRYLKEFLAYRSCFYWLLYREVRTRYRHAALGLGWAVFQPLASVLLLAGFFQKVAGIDAGNDSYPLFSACGIIPWLYFSKSVASSAQGFLSYAEVLKRNYFPRLFIPLIFVTSHLVDLFVGLLVIAVWVFLASHHPTPSGLLLITAATGWLYLLCFAIALWLGPIQVHFRDVAYATTFALQGLFFLSPILYSAKNAGTVLEVFLGLNPLTAILGLYRAGFLSMPVEMLHLVLGFLSTAVLLWSGILFFKKIETSLSDRL